MSQAPQTAFAQTESPLSRIVGVSSEAGRHKFVTGSFGSFDNEVACWEFTEDSNELHRIWRQDVTADSRGIESLAVSADLLAVASLRVVSEGIVEFFRLDASMAPIATASATSSDFNRISKIKFASDGTELLVADLSAIRIVSTEVQTESRRIEVEGIQDFAADPHHLSNFAGVQQDSIVLVDLRKQKAIVHQKEDLPRFLSIDYNPNSPFCIATSGHDSTVSFWDLRRLELSLGEFTTTHTHWITKVTFNRHHDQLFLTAGTDCLVNLWNKLPSSRRPGESEEEGRKKSREGLLVASVEIHEDAVRDISWSQNDAWIFASVGADGRISASEVPTEEKYNILF